MPLRVESPFPIPSLPLAHTWHKHTSTAVNNNTFNLGEFIRLIFDVMHTPGGRSWGLWEDGELLGFMAFEPIWRVGQIVDGSVHIAVARKAWGRRFIERGWEVVMPELFNSIPTLLRISGFTPAHYQPGLKVTRNLGLKIDGVIRDAISIEGVVRDLVITGLTRRDWEMSKTSEVIQ